MEITETTGKKKGRVFIHGFFTIKDVHPKRAEPKDVHIALAKALCQQFNVPYDSIRFTFHFEEQEDLLAYGRSVVLPLPSRLNEESKEALRASVAHVAETHEEVFRSLFEQMRRSMERQGLSEFEVKTLHAVTSKILNRLHMLSVDMLDEVEQVVEEHVRNKRGNK